MTVGIQHLTAGPSAGLIESLNTRWHKIALQGFLAIVLLHWAEHVFQAYQFYVMHLPRAMSIPAARSAVTSTAMSSVPQMAKA